MGSEYGKGMVKDKEKTEWVQNKENLGFRIRKIRNVLRIRRND